MKTLRSLFAVVALVSVAVGCSPSAKNEEQYWNNHQKSSEAQATRYPGFKQALEGQKARAQPIWDEALKISDEKQKALKMKEANEIMGRLVGRLDDVKYKTEGVESTLAKLNRLKLTRVEDVRRQEVVAAAYETIANVNRALEAAQPASVDEAETTIQPQVAALIRTQGDVDRAYKALQPPAPTKKKK